MSCREFYSSIHTGLALPRMAHFQYRYRPAASVIAFLTNTVRTPDSKYCSEMEASGAAPRSACRRAPITPIQWLVVVASKLVIFSPNSYTTCNATSPIVLLLLLLLLLLLGSLYFSAVGAIVWSRLWIVMLRMRRAVKRFSPRRYWY
jgi:hypothetical protein